MDGYNAANYLRSGSKHPPTKRDSVSYLRFADRSVCKVASAFQHKYDPYETIQYTKKNATEQNNASVVQPFPY